MDIARGDEFKEYSSVIVVRRDSIVRYYYDDCLGGGGNDRRNFPITHTPVFRDRPRSHAGHNTSDFYARPFGRSDGCDILFIIARIIQIEEHVVPPSGRPKKSTCAADAHAGRPV